METTSRRKPTHAMHEDENDDRFEAALNWPEDDPARGAEALRSIVADNGFDTDSRFEAAARLAEVDEAQAAEALRSIVADNAFDPDAPALRRRHDWPKSTRPRPPRPCAASWPTTRRANTAPKQRQDWLKSGG